MVGGDTWHKIAESIGTKQRRHSDEVSSSPPKLGGVRGGLKERLFNGMISTEKPLFRPPLMPLFRPSRPSGSPPNSGGEEDTPIH